MENREFGAYAMCLASAVAKNGGAPSATRFNLDKPGPQILAHLDLASVRSSLAQRRPAVHYFLSDFRFSLIRVAPLSVELATDSFRYCFDVLAAGDFRHSGSTELLVRFSDRAIEGTYDSTAILILTWPPDQDTIEAADAVDFLRSNTAPVKARRSP
jgi:hypothetical protein